MSLHTSHNEIQKFPYLGFGIMQGRLSPKQPTHLQSFPWSTWREEFPRAAALGFDCLEWLVDTYDLDSNPIFIDSGRLVTELTSLHSVRVNSVCAHFLIDGKIVAHPNHPDAVLASQALIRLLDTCDRIGISTVIIPLMESASLKSAGAIDNLIANLYQVENFQCGLALETDLNVADSLVLMEHLDNPRIGICFDVGNSTAFGYTPLMDYAELFPYVREVHIKDRVVGGGTQMLGQGSAPLQAFFELAAEKGYSGDMVLETPVGNDWERAARWNLDVVRRLSAGGRR